MLTLFLTPGIVAVATADRAPNSVEGYRDSAALTASLREIAAANPQKASVATIGRSREGREIVALTLGTTPTPTGGTSTSTQVRPAILITGGLDGAHLASSETALRLAKAILATKPELLDQVTFYVIPRANPDALELTLAGPGVHVGTTRPIDDDRDGVADEDGAKDLDGDGVIVQMRVKDPKPPYVASLVVDAADARLLKSPDLAKGELATYAVFTEGIDADSDGRIAEDGRGQVDLDRNFAHRYPEFAADAGPYQMSEPESLALTQFVLAHPDIVAAITYGRHDTLVKMPETKDMDATGRTPQIYLAADHPMYQELGKLYRDTTGQKRAPVGSLAPDPAGSFWLWLADHRGIVSVASTAWGRPDSPKPEAKPEAKLDTKPEAKPDAKPEAKPDAKPDAKPALPSNEVPKAPEPKAASGETQHAVLAEDDAEWRALVAGSHASGASDADDHDHSHSDAGFQTTPNTAQVTPAAQAPPAGGPPRGGQGAGGDPGTSGRRRGGGRGGPGGGPAVAAGPGAGDAKPADEDAVEWLAYLDATRGGQGFVAWHEVDHPVFGRVEIGGFDPLVRWNPPQSELDGIAEKQLAFVAGLVERLPKVDVALPTVTKLSDGLWRVETAISNGGRLPTVSKMGRVTRTAAPIVVRISTPVEKIVSGQRVRVIDGLDPGDRTALSWIVRADAGEAVDVTVGCGPFGSSSFHIHDGIVDEAPVVFGEVR